MTRNATGKILAAPPTWAATSLVPKVEAVAAATMPRGAIQPMNARSPRLSSVLMVATKATSGRVTTTSTATRARVGSTICFSDSGVTVAEMATNSTPMISCTKVSKNGRLAGMLKTRRFATASPIKIAAISPASSRKMSQAAATPITVASWLVVASTLSRFSLTRHNHSTATPTAAPATPMPMDSRSWPSGWPIPPLVLASTAPNTTAPKMPPIGSISDPSQDKIRCSRSDGRTNASSGPTTVGPDTTKIAPSITAAPAAHRPPLQRQARVIQDHRHRQRHQRLERRPQQAVRVDVGGQRAGGEAHREQDDQRRDAQPARHHLGAHREHQDQAHPEQDLVGAHRLPLS